MWHIVIHPQLPRHLFFGWVLGRLDPYLLINIVISLIYFVYKHPLPSNQTWRIDIMINHHSVRPSEVWHVGSTSKPFIRWGHLDRKSCCFTCHCIFSKMIQDTTCFNLSPPRHYSLLVSDGLYLVIRLVGLTSSCSRVCMKMEKQENNKMLVMELGWILILLTHVTHSPCQIASLHHLMCRWPWCLSSSWCSSNSNTNSIWCQL